VSEVVPSPPGRRVLVAVVTGPAGEATQRWRLAHDPEQARRLPPHATLCYWAPGPGTDPEALGAQVRHAFPAPVTVRLGAAREFPNRDRTIYLPVEETTGLDEARERLYDGTHLALRRDGDWDWHVTVVRYARDRDRSALLAAAADLPAGETWVVDEVAWMELRDGRYEDLARWRVGPGSEG
jgi:2'-5' RNA ligase